MNIKFTGIRMEFNSQRGTISHNSSINRQQIHEHETSNFARNARVIHYDEVSAEFWHQQCQVQEQQGLPLLVDSVRRPDGSESQHADVLGSHIVDPVQ